MKRTILAIAILATMVACNNTETTSDATLSETSVVVDSAYAPVDSLVAPSDEIVAEPALVVPVQ
jgi:hypothetical protein